MDLIPNNPENRKRLAQLSHENMSPTERTRFVIETLTEQYEDKELYSRDLAEWLKENGFEIEYEPFQKGN